MARYKWFASSDDGSFYEESNDIFYSEKDAYEDMRKAALEKMKWNTEYDEDFEDDTPIGYSVSFSKNEIVHQSYSGTYTYRIEEVFEYKVVAEYTIRKEFSVNAKSRSQALSKADEKMGNYFSLNGYEIAEKKYKLK